jgi:hypothetical protein
MFLKYLVKMDFILILSKFSGQMGPKPKRCVPWPFNNLTVLTVLRESALGPGLLPYSLGFTTALCSEMHWWNATSNALMLMLYTAKNAQVVPSWYRQAWTMLCGQLWTNCQPCCSKLFQLNNAVTTCWQYCSWWAAQPCSHLLISTWNKLLIFSIFTRVLEWEYDTKFHVFATKHKANT